MVFKEKSSKGLVEVWQGDGLGVGARDHKVVVVPVDGPAPEEVFVHAEGSF